MDKLKYILIIILLGGLCSTAFAQMNSFSQYHLTPVFTSPGDIGTTEYAQVLAHYRKQSVVSDLGFRTLALSGVYPLYYKEQNKRFGAIGLGVMNEASGSLGVLSSTSLQASYAYNFQMSQTSFLSSGLQFGYHSQKFDVGRIITDSQFQNGSYNSVNPMGENFSDELSKALMVDIGLTWYVLDEMGEKKLSLGAAAFNVNRADFQHLYDTENEPQPIRFSTYGSYNLYNAGGFHIEPTVRWFYENKGSQLNIGALMRYQLSQEEEVPMRDSHLGLGLWYGVNNAAVIGMELVQPGYVLAISYDLPTASGIDYAQVNNAVELTLGWRFNKSKNKAPKQAKTENKEEAELAEKQEMMVEKQPEVAIEEKTVSEESSLKADEEPEEKVIEEGKTENKFIYQDQLAEKKAKEPNRELSPEEERILEENVVYKLGSVAFTPEGQKKIDEVVEVLKNHPELRIRITGHTCTLGTERINESLSLKRAEVAKKAVVAKGIDPERIEIDGKSYLEPISTNKTEEERQKNRRIEFEVLKK